MRCVEFKLKNDLSTYCLPVADDVTVYNAMTAVLEIMGHGWSDVLPTFTITDLGRCQWFALCDHEATGTLYHPVLGDVPICDRCRTKIDKLRSE